MFFQMNNLSEIEKLNVVKEALAHVPFLLRNGFVLTREYFNESPVVGKIYNFVFEKADKNRSLKILFSPKYNEFKDAIVIEIHNEQNKNLEIGQYLELVGLLDDKPRFRLDFYPGDFREQMDHFFKFIDSAFQEETLRDILIGKTWVNLPFDWQGYK